VIEIPKIRSKKFWDLVTATSETNKFGRKKGMVKELKNDTKCILDSV
jgi:hypothetical protein